MSAGGDHQPVKTLRIVPASGVIMDGEFPANRIDCAHFVAGAHIDAAGMPEFRSADDNQVIDSALRVLDVLWHPACPLRDIRTTRESDHFGIRHSPLCLARRTHSGRDPADDYDFHDSAATVAAAVAAVGCALGLRGRAAHSRLGTPWSWLPGHRG